MRTFAVHSWVALGLALWYLGAPGLSWAEKRGATGERGQQVLVLGVVDGAGQPLPAATSRLLGQRLSDQLRQRLKLVPQGLPQDSSQCLEAECLGDLLRQVRHPVDLAVRVKVDRPLREDGEVTVWFYHVRTQLHREWPARCRRPCGGEDAAAVMANVLPIPYEQLMDAVSKAPAVAVVQPTPEEGRTAGEGGGTLTREGRTAATPDQGQAGQPGPGQPSGETDGHGAAPSANGDGGGQPPGVVEMNGPHGGGGQPDLLIGLEMEQKRRDLLIGGVVSLIAGAGALVAGGVLQYYDGKPAGACTKDGMSYNYCKYTNAPGLTVPLFAIGGVVEVTSWILLGVRSRIHTNNDAN